LKYIPERNILVAGISGGEIHVIDLEKKKEIHFLKYHQKGIFDINYSIKHGIMITVGGDGIVSYWSLKDFSFIKSDKLCNEKIRSIAVDPKEEVAAIGCGDGTIRIIGLNDLKEQHRFHAHNLSVNALRFHANKNILLSGGRDAHLCVWNTNDYEKTQSIPAHNYAIYSLSFSPSADMFATASRDKTVKIWDTETFEVLSRIDREKNAGHAFSVNKVLWMKDFLLSAGDDRKVIGWGIEKESIISRLN
jgi:WD40 repeat protein